MPRFALLDSQLNCPLRETEASIPALVKRAKLEQLDAEDCYSIVMIVGSLKEPEPELYAELNEDGKRIGLKA